jgi:hypothetical protein
VGFTEMEFYYPGRHGRSSRGIAEPPMRVATYVPVTKRLGLALSCSDGDDGTHGEAIRGVKLASSRWQESAQSV